MTSSSPNCLVTGTPFWTCGFQFCDIAMSTKDKIKDHMCTCIENPLLVVCRFGDCAYMSTRTNVDLHESWCEYGEQVLCVQTAQQCVF